MLAQTRTSVSWENVEESKYRSLSGTLLFHRTGMVPNPALVASKIQQKLGSLQVKDIVEENRMTKKILQLRPTLKFSKPISACEVKPVCLSDAFHGGSHEFYWRRVILCGLLDEDTGGRKHTFHPSVWSSHK